MQFILHLGKLHIFRENPLDFAAFSSFKIAFQNLHFKIIFLHFGVSAGGGDDQVLLVGE